MCGLIGFVGSGRPSDMPAAAAQVVRRGPDGITAWNSEDGRVHLRHALLSISDESPAARQPMVDSETGLVLAFNGEIYNHRDLRAGLKQPCATSSDTETILRMFGERGLATLTELRGMFAVALVDIRTRCVLLMRDPIGKKPLFYLQRSEGTYFGSSVVALATAASHTALDSAVARQWWELGHTPPSKSILSDCMPVLPGEVVELSWDGSVRSRTRITPPRMMSICRVSFADAVDELERRMKTSVKRRLADNPNPVALLSGGIDSTVVCKLALESGNVRLVTFEPGLLRTPDGPFARSAASRLGVQLNILPLDIADVRPLVEEAAELQDEPLAIISFVPLALMARRAAVGSRVLLTGDGGDEALCGYGRPSDWIANVPVTEPEDAGEVIAGPPLPDWMSTYAHRALGRDLVGHGLAKLDRATAEQGLEARSPMLDWDVLAFVRALPQNVVLPGETAKPLAKALLKGWPQSFLERKKAGFPFRLRGLWALSLYAGLRERIDQEAIERFRGYLPHALQSDPRYWSTLDIGRSFLAVYKIYVWSRFLSKMQSVPKRTATAA